MARPWKREEFKHPNLVDWVFENRGSILAEILTMIRAWFVADKPSYRVPVIGGFRTWSNKVGSILAHAGQEGFLGNLGVMYEESDRENRQWEAFLGFWYGFFQNQFVTITELTYKMRKNKVFLDSLPDYLSEAWAVSERSFKTKLGKSLAKKNGVHFSNGLCIMRGPRDRNKKVETWRLVREDTLDDCNPKCPDQSIQKDPQM